VAVLRGDSHHEVPAAVSSAYPVTAGNPPSSMAATTRPSSAISDRTRAQTRSRLQNRTGISAATRVCGHPVHTTMNALLAKTSPPRAAAAGRSRSRRRNRYVPPIAQMSSSSLM
jgi:hypothetical protein